MEETGAGVLVGEAGMFGLKKRVEQSVHQREIAVSKHKKAMIELAEATLELIRRRPVIIVPEEKEKEDD